MKAAIASGTQDIDRFLHVRDDWAKPTLSTAVDGKTGKLVPFNDGSSSNYIIVKVLACALAPGDCRLFKGKTDIMQLPKHGRPYVIGSDICGVVTEVANSETCFKVGDRIIARFDEPQPHGMCSSYACVKTSLSEICPSIPAIEACTLPASCAAAKRVATEFIHTGTRVLILGGSGGVGTFLCQYAKIQGCSYLAATTTQNELAKSLGVDRVIDYRNENWWELEDEFKEQPFDVVVDLVGGNKNWKVGACSRTKVLRKGAKYVQLVPGVETEIDMSRGYMTMIPFIFTMMKQSLYSKMKRSCPAWIPFSALNLKPGDLKGIVADVEEKRIRVVLDPESPFRFDTEGVREAMKLQWSIHAHGKVVIQIASENEEAG